MQGIPEDNTEFKKAVESVLQKILYALNKVEEYTSTDGESDYKDGYQDGILYTLQELGLDKLIFYREIHGDWMLR